MKRCVIVAAGDLKPAPLLDENTYLIAADAAAYKLIKAGIKPNLIIGDWDSADAEPESDEEVEKITLPHEKDDTDTHMCIKEALRRGFKKIEIYGALGGSRLDHSLANIQSLIFIAENGCVGSIYSGGQVMTVIKNSSISFEAGHDGYVSVFALGAEAKGVSISGLMYEVSDVTLNNSFPIGASNELIGKEACVSVKNGTIAVVYPKEASCCFGQLEESCEELALKIARLEFKAFDKVRNEGGRAGCQDDWGTFSIMRQSQYLTWNKEMLLQYFDDFDREFKLGHNLIAEKYGRMMESTTPAKYEEIKGAMPEISEDKKRIIESIVGIQVSWMEEFAKEYPGLASNARSIHTSEDTPWNTSYETYLRGEISTYSDQMLVLYGRFIAKLAANGENLAKMTMANSALLYGYKSLEDAETAIV